MKTGVSILAVVMFLFIACRKDANDAPDDGTGNMVLTPELPSWIRDSIVLFNTPADNPTTAHGVALGRKLFYENALSDNYTQNCGTCHVQSHGFSDPLPFSVGTNGAVGTRSSMALINLGWDNFLFWDGRRTDLEGQAHDPVTNPIEMRNTWPVVVQRLQADAQYPPLFQAAFGTDIIDSVLAVKAIAQFERTLLSFGSRYDRYRFLGDSTALNGSEKRGYSLYSRDAHCDDCHTEPRMSDGFLRNNGLDLFPPDSGLAGITGLAGDMGNFKVPTLRNIAATAPYMHDSRFNTLEEVMDFYATGVNLNAATIDAHMAPWVDGSIALDAQDQADIVAFLHALTDSTFLTDPAFAAP